MNRPSLALGFLLIVLAVKFAVVSTGNGIDLFVEHRNFVGFETVG